MKSKLLGSIVSATLALTASATLAGPLEDRIAAGEPIRLGFAAAAPWAHPGENNEPLGFVNQITLDLLARMGHTEIEPVVTDWAGLIPSLMAGRVDVITGGMYILGSRCANIDFSEPIGQFGNAFIVPDGNPGGLQTYEDIKNAGVTMAAVAGYVNVEEALKVGIPESKIMQLPGTTEVLAAVKAGRAEIGAMTAVEAYDLAAKTDGIGHTDTNALPQWTFNWVAVGFHPEDDQFRADFNAAMPGYIGSDDMLSKVEQWDYLPSNVPGDDASMEWACANR
ncbi:transporter substrate-binding domain-containing protein (plasmid) [Aliisedimentitalea scapharcae]|uniref:Transporter substrate-binding domain-containing protein n=1 Tax=Aliisedimentitalea scapharcae TaxID=1524259 RepID=A0ABZ2XZD0_9RHOB|nr:transporter substrate-binding domain-containing protein [Rhodobacteraceae bacterium M382]